MKKVRIGVLGAYRGTSMINYCKRADHAEVVAICDKSPEALDAQRTHLLDVSCVIAIFSCRKLTKKWKIMQANIERSLARYTHVMTNPMGIPQGFRSTVYCQTYKEAPFSAISFCSLIVSQ